MSGNTNGDDELLKLCDAIIQLSTRTMVPMSTGYLVKVIENLRLELVDLVAKSDGHRQRIDAASSKFCDLSQKVDSLESDLAILRGEMNTLKAALAARNNG